MFFVIVVIVIDINIENSEYISFRFELIYLFFLNENNCNWYKRKYVFDKINKDVMKKCKMFFDVNVLIINNFYGGVLKGFDYICISCS